MSESSINRGRGLSAGWRGCALAAALSFVPNAAAGQPGPASSSTATSIKAAIPLPPLPELPSLELPLPKPEVVARLAQILAHLQSKDATERENGATELLEVQASMVPALEARIHRLAERADKNALKALLERTRRRSRDTEHEQSTGEGEPPRETGRDYLDLLLKNAEPSSETWRDLVELMALSRMLRHVGTIQAARRLVDIYMRFGEFVRVDTQLQLAKLGDRGVAVLIETRRHKAEKVARWAERQLDVLGKGIPSETVQTKDYDALADILRAYGRLRDPDAARIIISFCNSERSQIREAARQAVVMFGDVAIWQLRDAYENVTGERPPRDWSWERTARELFGRFDRQRHARVFGLFEAGLGALGAKDLTRMKASFDAVLVRSPTFERAAEMAPGYLEYAQTNAEKNRAQALDAARRAERIAVDDAIKRRAASLRSTFEALELLDKGVVDQALLQNALTLNPDNAVAKDSLSRVRHGNVKDTIDHQRWGIAGVIAALGILGIAWVGLRRPKRPGASPTPDAAPSAGSPTSAPAQVDSVPSGPADGSGPDASVVADIAASGAPDTDTKTP